MTWVVKTNQAYHIFKAGAKSIAVNVRYSYEVSEGVYQYVYVTFTWTPSPLNFTPNGTIENSAKIDKYWYEKLLVLNMISLYLLMEKLYKLLITL